MAEAWIRGKAVALDAAIAEAAKLLAASRTPVVAGLGADVAGARAAIKLAQRLGGAVDHMHSEALLRDLSVMRETGMMVTTPAEAGLRADLLLLVGPIMFEARPDLRTRLLADSKRRIVWLCPKDTASSTGGRGIDIVGDDPTALPVMLAALRAKCAGRPVGGIPSQELAALADELTAARFGVAVWSAAALDDLTIEMLCGLVNDLNDSTRFSGLPLAPADNAAAVQLVSGWMTGFPLRTGFGRNQPEHDPWRFDAVRLIESGEVDCALWISAYGTQRPAWKRALPLIALGSEAERLDSDVAIKVGRPGTDHHAVAYLEATAALATVTARAPADTIAVAEAVTRIAAALPAAQPC